jgi:hypothetical protein
MILPSSNYYWYDYQRVTAIRPHFQVVVKVLPLFSQVPEWIHLNLSNITIIMTLFTKMMCTFFFPMHPTHKRILVSLSHLHCYFQTDMGSTSKVVLVGIAHVMGNYIQCLCVYIYILLSFPENIRKKELNIYLHRQCNTKVTYKKPFYIKKSLKCVKGRCSELELSVDQTNQQTWLTTLLRGKERLSLFFLTPAFQQKFSKPSCINYLLYKKLSNANNLNKPPPPLRIFITFN